MAERRAAAPSHRSPHREHTDEEVQERRAPRGQLRHRLGTSLAAPRDSGARRPRRRRFPSRPLKLVVPYSAGTPVDEGARILAAEMQTSLGQPVGVENKPGADGVTAVEAVARSASGRLHARRRRRESADPAAHARSQAALPAAQGPRRRRGRDRDRARVRRAARPAGQVAAGTRRLRPGQPREGEIRDAGRPGG